ncbi:MAG: CPBP family intramembrane glutamic endopeptidase [Mycobacteriales bacterium]
MLAPTPPTPARPAGLPPPRVLRREILVLFAVSLGASALFALVNFIGDLTAPAPLAQQHATLVGSLAPGRPWLDLALQLTAIAVTVAPVALGAHLLGRSGESLHTIGVDFAASRTDLAKGAVLAAVIGAAGLALYLGAVHLGVNLTVVPAALPAVRWRIPVLCLAALQNGVLEEVLVLGYLLHRLRQLGWSDPAALLASATLRGAYHLYQGAGGFAGNFVMGLIFGRLYQRWGRAMPLVVAHTLIDAGAFVGYTLLAGRVSWLPR